MRETPKDQANKSSTTRPTASKPLKSKLLSAPRPDPRMVHSGTPLISYVVASAMFVALMLCARLTHQPPAPGQLLAMPAGGGANASGHQPALPNQLTARTLTSALAAPGQACAISEAALRQGGGSFSSLAIRPDGVVLVWAGAATAANAPCPAGTNLLLTRDAWQTLQNWPPAPGYRH